MARDTTPNMALNRWNAASDVYDWTADLQTDKNAVDAHDHTTGKGLAVARVGAGVITDANVAAANKDGAVGTASMRTIGAGALQAAGGNHVHAGQELAYGEITANVSITATTSATANSVVSSGAVTYDGTAVYVEFFAAAVNKGTTWLILVLYDGATELGRIAQISVSDTGLIAKRKLTPTAASHTYQIKAYVDAGTGTVYANTGALGVTVPAFCRVVKA